MTAAKPTHLAEIDAELERAEALQGIVMEFRKAQEEKAAPGCPDDAIRIQELAELSLPDYDRRRESVAAEMGIRVGTLDKMVEQERPKQAVSDGDTMFPEREPWSSAVDGVELLGALVDVLNRHVMMPAAAVSAAALWILHAHAHDTASISPLLGITSPSPECGKTTLLTLLQAVSPRALAASNITAAALFRSVELWRPTVLVDEADTFLRDSDELRGVLNSGHNRAAAFVVRTTGDDHEPKKFLTWAPKVIALIGQLPPTLASRSIHIEMRRKAPGERVEPLRADRLDHLEPLARKAARWAIDHDDALRRHDPAMPASITGRRADNWRHLLAIADLAGGDWPVRARAAAEALTAGGSEQTNGILLLSDVRDLFAKARRITSKELAATLGAMIDRPWSEYGRTGKPITERQIAKLFDPFGVNPKPIRFSAGVAKGYAVEQFADAFARYLPDEVVTRLQATDSASLGALRSVTPESHVTDAAGPEPADCLGCNRVTDETPLPSEHDDIEEQDRWEH